MDWTMYEYCPWCGEWDFVGSGHEQGEPCPFVEEEP